MFVQSEGVLGMLLGGTSALRTSPALVYHMSGDDHDGDVAKSEVSTSSSHSADKSACLHDGGDEYEEARHPRAVGVITVV